MVLMDSASAQSFSGNLAEGGLLVLNSSLISKTPDCDGCRLIGVPANEIAADIGNDRTVNMALIGAWAAGTEVLTVAGVAESLREMLPERHHVHMPDNEAALERGAQLARGAD
jgi:2-oxoglutarate ferredoxin oxidoreductase subunit gamma